MLDADTIAAVDTAAVLDGRSVASWVRQAIREKLARDAAA